MTSTAALFTPAHTARILTAAALLGLAACGGGSSGGEARPVGDGAAREMPRYVVRDVAPLAGDASASDLDGVGRVVGTCGSEASPDGFVWEDGVVVPLVARAAKAINDLGDIVGDAGGVAYLWRGDAAEPLAYGTAHDVNNVGAVVGEGATSGGHLHAFRWHDGTLEDLGTLGGDWSVAYGVNDTGTAVGWAEAGDGVVRAVRWQGSDAVDLGTLGGDWSMAYAVNEQGQVAGYSATADGADHAFRVEADGRMTDLGSLGGYSVAYDLDDRGRVVGESGDGAGGTRGFLWEDGVMYDLNALVPEDGGWVITRAVAINDAGQIVAEGLLDGAKRPCLLDPR